MRYIAGDLVSDLKSMKKDSLYFIERVPGNSSTRTLCIVLAPANPLVDESEQSVDCEFVQEDGAQRQSRQCTSCKQSSGAMQELPARWRIILVWVCWCPLTSSKEDVFGTSIRSCCCTIVGPQLCGRNPTRPNSESKWPRTRHVCLQGEHCNAAVEKVPGVHHGGGEQQQDRRQVGPRGTENQAENGKSHKAAVIATTFGCARSCCDAAPVGCVAA